MSNPKKKTPLQEAIERIENGAIQISSPYSVVSMLESLLPKEEEYTMDAFLAGGDAMQKIKEGKPYTDFINYFKQYKAMSNNKRIPGLTEIMNATSEHLKKQGFTVGEQPIDPSEGELPVDGLLDEQEKGEALKPENELITMVTMLNEYNEMKKWNTSEALMIKKLSGKYSITRKQV